MGKKKIYNLKDHERYEKRVDIFRSVQQSPSHQKQDDTSISKPKIVVVRGSNAFVNQSYLSSETINIEHAIRGVLMPGSEEKKGNPLFVNDDPVWTTRASFSASPLHLYGPTVDEDQAAREEKASEEKRQQAPLSYPALPAPPVKEPIQQTPISLPITRFPSKAEFYPPLSQEPIKFNKKKKRKQLLVATLFLFMLLAIIALVVVLVVFFRLNSKTVFDYSKLSNRPSIQGVSNICNPECNTNGDQFCVHASSNMTTPSCECKPGYSLNASTSRCEKSMCYESYYPYTFINNYANASRLALPYNTRFLRPHCCPQKTYLTSSCCGVAASTANPFVPNTKRIIGGQEVSEPFFPWLVFVTQLYRATPDGPLLFINNCSGSLISDRVVLTAAHCLDFDTSVVTFNSEFPDVASLVRVYAGLRDLSSAFSNQTVANYQIRVRKVLIHPLFNKSTFENDLALLFLDKAVIRNENIDYICLYGYTKDDSLMIKRKAPMFTAGWGSTNPSWQQLTFSNRLRYVDAYVYPMINCTYIFPGDQYSYLFDSVTHVCAGYHANIAKDTCYGDSGAPLMVQLNGQWFIYGILSYGSQPDCAKGPAMYSRIAYYFEWIIQMIY